LSSTHCVGKHLAAAVPVVTGVHMPYVDAESPSEMLLKRSRCALVPFHPFRAATDLVADPLSDAAWVDTYRRWEPTRTSFVCQIMANLDDFHRVEKQAQEAAADEYDHLNVLGKDDDDDNGTGTRHDVDSMADVGEVAGQESDLLISLSEADCDNCTTGDELPVFLTSTRAGKPADAATMSRPLLTPAAEMAASAYASLRETHVETSMSFSGDELNRYVEEHSTDASDPFEHYHQERPAHVIELLSNVLDPAAQHGSRATGGSSDQTSITKQNSPRYREHSRSMSGSTPLLQSSLPRSYRRFCGKSGPGSSSPLQLAPPTPVEVVTITTLRHNSKTSRLSCFLVAPVAPARAALSTRSVPSACFGTEKARS
jgi:hypothetical protein